MTEVTLLLGSNLGDRKAYIDAALEALDKAFGDRRLRMTGIIETDAVGFDGPPFLNTVVVYSTRRSPESVLHLCKRIERSLGRREVPEYGPDGNRIYHNRPIDIDILFHGEHCINTPVLTIPHPQVYSRAFVKQLLDSLPELVKPSC